MTHSLPIYEHSHDDRSDRANVRKEWWANFTKTIREEHFGLGFDFKQYEWIKHRTEMLAKYNAWFDGSKVHFTTDQDATLFLLRWS